MSDLADRIIDQNAAKEEPTRPILFDIKEVGQLDEFGMQICNVDDYLVARLLYLDYHEQVAGGRLYLKNGEVYANKVKIEENKNNLYRLARWRYPIKEHQVQWLWARIKEFLPELDESKLMIAPGVLWNRDTGDIEYRDPNITIGV